MELNDLDQQFVSIQGGEPRAEDDSQKASRIADEELLKEARERFKICQEAEADVRREALVDLNFRAGKQWPDEIKSQREYDKRPMLTINRIVQFIRQVTNEQRQNRPSIKINPVGDGADQDTAEACQRS